MDMTFAINNIEKNNISWSFVAWLWLNSLFSWVSHSELNGKYAIFG